MRGLSFSALAVEIISKFVGPEEIPAETIKQIVYSSYSTFRTAGTVFFKENVLLFDNRVGILIMQK